MSEPLPQLQAIKVRGDHIANAVRRDSHHCMVADAIRERYSWARRISADLQSVRFTNPEKGVRYYYMTPPQTQKNLLAFDKGEQVRPFKFTLKAGHTRPAGWKANHLNSDRTKRKYRKTGKKRFVPKAEREFGLRMFVEE